MNKSILISLICTTFVGLLIGQQKQIHFAHGLGGSVQSWSELRAIIDIECPNVETTNNTYTSGNGIQAYIDDFVSFRTAAGASTNDIAIGHSFGGIALRAMDNPTNSLYGGYITVASPHEGAKLANSVNSGKVEVFLEDACKQVFDDPSDAVKKLISNPFLTIVGDILSSITDVSSVVCFSLWESVLAAEGWMGSPFTGSNGQSINELELDGAASNLPASTMPSVGITGIANKDDEVHWKLLQERSGINVPGMMKDVSSVYSSSANVLQSVGGVLSSLPWPFNRNGNRMLNLARELNEGARWIDMSESGWLELIGAGTGGSWVSEEVEVWVCDITPDEIPQDPDDPCNPWDGNCWQTVTEWFFVPRADLDNDGVVVEDSQFLPGRLMQEEVEGVTHFGEQTSIMVRSKIGEIIDPEAGINPVFEISNCIL